MQGTKSAHLVGICGSGMKAIAEMLHGRGWPITGSDLRPSSLLLKHFQNLGIQVRSGNHPQNVPDRADLLIYSPAVAVTNPERVRARELGIQEQSSVEFLGDLMGEKIGLSIAGTHGKSTATALTGWILEQSGKKPSVIAGAELRNLGRNGWSGSGEHFVVESCEFHRNFMKLKPSHAVLLGIEQDHFDCFGSLDELTDAFAQFARLIPSSGIVLIRDDCPASLRATEQLFGRRLLLSRTNPHADWYAEGVVQTEQGSRFRLVTSTAPQGSIEVEFPVLGEHHIWNALAAAALSRQAGVELEAIAQALASFPGLKRRFEILGEPGGVTLIDDYAHHPTAVAATIQTARTRFRDRGRLTVVFQPHQVSRTRALMDEFAASLCGADLVYITPVYGARESFEKELTETSQELVQSCRSRGLNAHFLVSLDQILTRVHDDVAPGDVLLTLGAGDIDQIHHALTVRLQRNHSSE